MMKPRIRLEWGPNDIAHLRDLVSELQHAIESAPCLVARESELTYECRHDKLCRVCAIPDKNPRPLEMVTDYPPGTIALLLEVHIADKRDGPSMESYAKVFLNGSAGFVWLYECEVIRDNE